MKSTLPSTHAFHPDPADATRCQWCCRTRDVHRPAPVRVKGRLRHDERCYGDDEHPDACVCGLDD